MNNPTALQTLPYTFVADAGLRIDSWQGTAHDFFLLAQGYLIPDDRDRYYPNPYMTKR